MKLAGGVGEGAKACLRPAAPDRVTETHSRVA